MIQVKAIWLKLTNFKGIENLLIDFNPSTPTNIEGPNASGKTTIADAIFWLVRGKDSLDREKFGIKNTVNTSLNRSEHQVEAMFDVNGQQQKVRRVYREIWRKPKGQPEEVYSGNEQLFFINDVPMQAGEFEKRVADFLNPAIFKLLSNPAAFPKLPWQEQRSIIGTMAGDITDAQMLDLMATLQNKDRIFNLTNILNSGKSFVDFKKQLAAEKKLKQTRLDEIPGRIDEQTRTMPESANYVAIQAQIDAKAALIKSKQNDIADINILINDETARFNSQNQANNQRQQKISSLELDIIKAENQIKTNAQQAGNDRAMKIQGIKNQIQNAETNLKSKNLLVESTNGRIKLDTEAQNQIRNEWHVENARKIEIDPHAFECPTCRRAFEAETAEQMREKLEQNFNSEQKRKKDALQQRGVGFTKSLAVDNELLVSLNTQIDAINKELEIFRAQLRDAEALVTDVVNVDQLIASDKNIAGLKQNISALKAQIEDITPADVQQYRDQITAIQAEIDSINAEITTLNNSMASKGQRERMQARINELMAEQKQLAQQIATIEGTEFDIFEFEKFKVNEIERLVASNFKYVKFKMFTQTIEGNDVPNCIPMLNGVPYGDLNTAGKVWAGLDIINTLSTFYGVTCPVIVDCRESVTDLPETNMQVISLKVGGDKLTVS